MAHVSMRLACLGDHPSLLPLGYGHYSLLEPSSLSDYCFGLLATSDCLPGRAPLAIAFASWAMTHAPIRFARLDHCSPLKSGGLLIIAVGYWLLVIVASLYYLLLNSPIDRLGFLAISAGRRQ